MEYDPLFKFYIFASFIVVNAMGIILLLTEKQLSFSNSYFSIKHSHYSLDSVQDIQGWLLTCAAQWLSIMFGMLGVNLFRHILPEIGLL